MTQGANEYTAEQLLSFSQQAISNNRFDDAKNILDHIVRHHATSIQAIAAAKLSAKLSSPEYIRQRVILNATPDGDFGTNGTDPSANQPANNSQTEFKSSKQKKKTFRRPTDDYKTSVAIAEFTSGVGWLFIVAGIILFLIAFSAGGSFGGRGGFGVGALAGLLAGGAVIGFGLLLVLQGQSARAQFDTANMTKELLEIERFRLRDE